MSDLISAARAFVNALESDVYLYLEPEMVRLEQALSDALGRAEKEALPVSRVAQAHRFLEWNRRQIKRPVEIGMEYHVFEVAAALVTGVELALHLVEPDVKEAKE